MTLWQDQPPQTRRQAREQERSQTPVENAPASSRRAATVEPTPAGEIPAVTTPYIFASGRDGAAPEAPASGPFGEKSAPPARPNLPTYGASFDSILSQQPQPEEGAEAPAPQSPLFRDSASPDANEPVTTPVALVPASELAAPVAPAPSEDAGEWAPERTLTRRELRAMLQAQEANQFAGGRTDEVAAEVEPAAPTFTPPLAEAPVESPDIKDPLAALFAQNAREAEQDVAPAPSAPSLPLADKPAAPSAWPFAPLAPSAAEPDTDARPFESSNERTASDDNVSFGLPLVLPTPPAEPVAPAPQPPTAFVPVAPAPPVAPAAPTPPAPQVSDAKAVDESERQPYQPPVGHWSTAGELDDKNQQFDQIISRSVGSSGAATTTNALILPVVPSAPDATGPLTSTGEILVTGSIDLPRGMGSTGQHPDRYDSSDMDRMFEQDENEFNTSDVAPIRASRAVSTHTSTRGVITPPKKRGGRLPVVLSITAAVLAIGVVGLLVAGYILKVF